MNTSTKESFAVLWQHWRDLLQVLHGYAEQLAAAGL
jgi:hypothetical protein